MHPEVFVSSSGRAKFDDSDDDGISIDEGSSSSTEEDDGNGQQHQPTPAKVSARPPGHRPPSTTYVAPNRQQSVQPAKTPQCLGNEQQTSSDEFLNSTPKKKKNPEPDTSNEAVRIRPDACKPQSETGTFLKSRRRYWLEKYGCVYTP